MPADVRENALQAVEAEFRQERANALGRAGRKLEQLIAATQEALDRLQSAPPEERPAARAAFDQASEQAQYQLWCYIVQREAIGLIGHADVYDYYRIPVCPPELR